MTDSVPLTLVSADGSKHQIEATVGESVMAAARANEVPGIVATCGGSAMCATCHVYVEESYAERLPEVGFEEDGLLGFTVAERRATSRLSCQVVVTPELAGAEIHIPDAQV